MIVANNMQCCKQLRESISYLQVEVLKYSMIKIELNSLIEANQTFK